MSNPYDPVESDLRKQLVETRIMLHHERCRLEGANTLIRLLKVKTARLEDTLDGIDVILGAAPVGDPKAHAKVVDLLYAWREDSGTLP